MTDLDPDVRDRAAAELCRVYLSKTLTLPAGLPGIQFHEITEDGRDVYRKLVDAVAEALAAEQPKWMHANIADCAETELEVMRLQARVDELASILESKNADLRKLLAQLDQATVRAHNGQVRVDQLTAALFELTAVADRVIHREGNHGVTWMGLLTNKVAESRAVLAKAAK